jgi:hypothetical protein
VSRSMTAEVDQNTTHPAHGRAVDGSVSKVRLQRRAVSSWGHLVIFSLRGHSEDSCRWNDSDYY